MAITSQPVCRSTWYMVLGWGFRVSLDFFSRGLHTRTTSRQLGLLVKIFSQMTLNVDLDLSKLTVKFCSDSEHLCQNSCKSDSWNHNELFVTNERTNEPTNKLTWWQDTRQVWKLPDLALMTAKERKSCTYGPMNDVENLKTMFLPCDAMRGTVFAIVILSICPSVCLSVTLVDCVHMVRPTIMISSPYGSPVTLLSGDIKFIPKFEGDHPERGRWMRVGWVRIGDFRPISRRISETVQDTTKVTINH